MNYLIAHTHTQDNFGFRYVLVKHREENDSFSYLLLLYVSALQHNATRHSC